MRLLFEWIYCGVHGKLKNCGLNFTDDYKIQFDYETNVLTISHENNSNIEQGFYSIGKNNVVSQITCFAGKNGSGKTSILTHLYKTDLPDLNLIQDERKRDDSKTVKVYAFKKGIKVFHNLESDVKVKYDNSTFVVPSTSYADEKVMKIFLSNDAFIGLNDNGPNKMAITQYDISARQWEFLSKICRLNSPLFKQGFSALFNEQLRAKANPSYFQHILYLYFYKGLLDKGRIDRFSYLKNISAYFQRVDQSDAMIDSFGLYNIILQKVDDIKEIIQETISKADIDEIAQRNNLHNIDYQYLKMFAIIAFAKKKCNANDRSSIYANLKLNLTAELLLTLYDLDVKICDLKSYSIIDLLGRLEEIKNNFSRRLQCDNRVMQHDIESIYSYFCKAEKSVNGLFRILGKRKSQQGIDVAKNENRDLLNFIWKEVDHGESYVLKYLWVNYGCSAGERAFLNIFSWLNYISTYRLEIQDNREKRDILLMIDEPDLYCHPEWQRKMIYEIIETLELLYHGKHIHLIFTTHSPLCLSDIPGGNVLKIWQNDSNQIEVKPMDRLTFGANIFDLYKDGFYLDSFMGEFARMKIGNTIKVLYDSFNHERQVETDGRQVKVDIKQARKVVKLIGEPVMQKKLTFMLEYKRKD